MGLGRNTCKVVFLKVVQVMLWCAAGYIQYAVHTTVYCTQNVHAVFKTAHCKGF